LKAALISEFGGADMLRIGEAEKPSPGAGQVLVKVATRSASG
jgi:NADPH:quinone reductase-like Zn-dependent oxidoreductase